MPFKRLKDIRSIHFQRTIPKRGKFKLGQKVWLGYSKNAGAAKKKYDTAQGTVVGFQNNKNYQGRRIEQAMNRYYVRFGKEIFGIATQYLVESPKLKGNMPDWQRPEVISATKIAPIVPEASAKQILDAKLTVLLQAVQSLTLDDFNALLARR